MIKIMIRLTLTLFFMDHFAKGFNCLSFCSYCRVSQLIQGSGQFFHDKMPGCCLPSLIAATALQFTAGCLKLSLEQEPTPCFAFLGGNSPLPIRSTGAIILS
jgi:hypothetical protein